MMGKRALQFVKNDILPLEITGYTAEGSGVGRADGAAIFVPGAAVGDKLLVRILKTAKTYAYGKIESITSPSPDRITPDCPQFSKCGGCVFRHITYAAECRAKEQRVRDAFQRIAGLSPELVGPIVPAPSPDRYRNKAQFPLGQDSEGRLVAGFYAPHSHRIVPCRDCLLQPASFAAAIEAVRTWHGETGESVYDERTGKGCLRHLYLRAAMAEGGVMACLVINGRRVRREDRLVELLRAKVPGLRGVVLNTNCDRTNVILGPSCRTIWGEGSLIDRLCGLRFSISPHSFYQVNRDQAEQLYAQAAQYANLTGRETLLDLYCGTGTIGLSMAAKARRVIGVEVVPQAVADARSNAQRNGIQNAVFRCADAVQAAASFRAEGLRPDVVVLDPPRKGCGEALVHTVAQMAPARVVYVSCDPATLARDLKWFDDCGYVLRAATPFDLFPRTAHVETVALLSKLHAEQQIEVELNEDG